MNYRIVLVYLFLFFLVGLIVWRLVDLQILNGEYYLALSEGAYNSLFNFQKERGKILFEDGKELAININSFYVFVNPQKIKEKEKTTQILSKILDLEEGFVLTKLNKNTSYLILKKELNNEEIEALKKEKIKGVFIGEEKVRYYPHGKLAANVVGFLNAEGNGQYGLEEYYDEKLKEGTDIYLTLDYNIQFKAEMLLEKAKETLAIEGGQIIVLEPHSGKILALADFPSFDPNKYKEEKNLEIFKNSATQKIFEPGSIFKPITIAAALEEGKISPDTAYIDEGFVKIGGWTIKNFEERVWGKRTMTEVLEWSINTGAVFVEKQLGHELFRQYVEKFGFFEKSGVDLPETWPENKEFKKGYEIGYATASFGQGIEVTPLQMARALVTIANGGKLIKPFLLSNKKNELEHSEIQVISENTAFKTTQMLVSVVEQGYGKRAKIPGYWIAGKTGTSQIPYSSLGIKRKGYSEKTWQSFAGWFPAFNPKFLILVKLDNPRAQAAGASTTLIAKEMIEYLIYYFRIPPDYNL